MFVFSLFTVISTVSEQFTVARLRVSYPGIDKSSFSKDFPSSLANEVSSWANAVYCSAMVMSSLDNDASIMAMEVSIIVRKVSKLANDMSNVHIG